MKTAHDLIFSASIVLLYGITLSLLAPYFPVDETRYLTVAWEMKLNDSFMMPLLNGFPYSHKPPFLFWLINLDWYILGINEITLRFIPLLFSVFNIVMVYIIAFMLWQNKKIAGYAAVIFSSTLVYLIWSALIMFDVILTFWVLIGIVGLLSAARNYRRVSWLLVALSIGGGLLTKGPVIFVHILPVSLLYFLWMPDDGLDRKRWYMSLSLAVFIGISIALLWAVPAAMTGGESFRDAIFWGQTVNRVVSSFAHRRPFWWYAAILPALFLPWVLVKPAWCGYSGVTQDRRFRFLSGWVFSTIILFSIISGKQMYYLIPVLPAVSLLMAKNIATYGEKIRASTKSHYPVAVFYVMLGVTALLLPFMKLDGLDDHLSVEISRVLATGFILLGGVMFYIKRVSTDGLVKIVAISSTIAVIVVIFAGEQSLFSRYDIRDFSRFLQRKHQDGYEIINYGIYHGEYQFLGRLTKPIIVMRDKNNIKTYAKAHKRVLCITYEKQEYVVDEDDVLYQQLYRGKKIILWNKRGIDHLQSSDPTFISERI